MATYALTQVSNYEALREWTFTGGVAATALADFTDTVDARNADIIMVQSSVVKAGTTDTATITLQGSNDNTNWQSLADISNSPNDGTNTSAATAGTFNLNLEYVIGGWGNAYSTPRFKYYRAAYTTSGSTDNKNITNGRIVLRKNV